ncbi:MAG: HAMP domain-containing protein [Actinobacteria bacterium]|nr:HAMP domain-containing protein [Actinomycetota bacterium]
MGNSEKGTSRRSSRSIILVQITALVAIIFLVFGIVSLLGNRRSQNNLIEASKEKMIECEAETISSSGDYIIKLVYELISASGGKVDLATTQEQLTTAIVNQERTQLVDYGIGKLDELIQMGVYGLDMAFVALPEIPPLIEKPMVIMSSTPDLMFMKLSGKLTSLMEKDYSYKLFEEGIPELGLDGAHLLMAAPLTTDITAGQTVYLFMAKPMQEQLDAMNDYYKKENNSATVFMIILTVICIAILVFVTFFVLSYLIRNRITRPIDELEEAAEKVIEGDFDSEVPVRPGEEFTNLKKAFNGMISSIRDVINKATGG